ncbi:MAG: hypothetical protein JW779_14905 [Candidatus Thorarchaeota archaeon]|nr:hypothetical protein [Candidatus Thorarchaeota archaeon]
MGTDRIREYDCKCKCGKGTVEIDYCTPDHGWPTATPFWYEARLKCANCSVKYEIHQQDDDFVYVSKQDIADRKVLQAKVDAKNVTLLNSPRVQAMRSRLIQFLDSRPSKAAIHRTLQSIQLSSCTIQTFRKHWKGADEWLRFNFSVHTIPTFMKLLDITDLGIQLQIKAIETLEKQASDTLPPVGNPIYTV